MDQRHISDIETLNEIYRFHRLRKNLFTCNWIMEQCRYFIDSLVARQLYIRYTCKIVFQWNENHWID